jgi:hypothetical protein
MVLLAPQYCAGELDMREAQREIADDWTES